MNSIAEQLETSFFPKLFNHEDDFILNSEEITNLAFHLGDSIQLFFDKNCFGSCPLNCPTKLNDKVTQEDFVQAGKIPENMEIGVHVCTTKEQCLKHDLLNYVIVDTVVDFYLYDLKFDIESDDPLLNKLIHFISDKILNLIKKEGAALLSTPNENASELFDQLIEIDDNSWSEPEYFSLEEAEEAELDEPWKRSEENIFTAIEDFENLNSSLSDQRSIQLFKKYLTTYLGPVNIKELVYEDLEEFFLIVFPTEFASEERVRIEDEIKIFEQFIKYIDYNYEKNFNLYWNNLKESVFPELQRTFKLSQQFHQQNSYIDFQLSDEKSSASLIDGFFEIVDLQDGLFVVEDIHIKEQYQMVNLSLLNTTQLEPGDIVNMQLVPDGKNDWRAIWVECVFTAKAKYYLV